MREILKNIFIWRVFQDDKGYYFNGWILNLPEGQLIVDPPSLSKEVVKMILSLKNPLGILLTNWSHKRATNDVLSLRSMPVFIHQNDSAKLEPDFPISFIDETTQLSSISKIIPSPGRSPGEVALILNQDKGILILGDVIIGHPALGLAYLPNAKIANKLQLQKTVENLCQLNFDALLLGDGDSILKNAKLDLMSFSKNPVTMPDPGNISTTTPKGC
jgi:hypothetical protein